MPISPNVAATPAEPDGESVAVDALAEYVSLLRQVQSKIENLSRMRSDLQDKIKNALGDAEIGTVAGRPVVSWKRTLRVALSQRLVKALHPEVIPECEEITEVRSFRLLS
ncbi:hypothetical protein [Saccharopolyspora hattusasensis]|uniref:hypothetical protein n=1 Tax=Saccharopolyspora hattusasensis TaxID=1128679 RepID=UPI003D957AA1